MPRPTSLALPILLVLLTGAAASAVPPDGGPTDPVSVTTDNETPVLYDDDDGGNASGDDPAIWVDPDDSSNSVVIVTAKEGGLRVYDLDAQELQSLSATPAPQTDAVAGRYNNVDIAYGLEVGGQRVDVAVVSDRYNDSLRFFAIDADGAAADVPLTEITAPDQAYLFQPDREGVDSEHTAYGLAVYQPRRGPSYVVVTQEGTTAVATARLVVTAEGVGYTAVTHLDLPGEFALPDGSTWVPCEEPGVLPQLEGVSVDQAAGVIYAAQEDVGLWRVKLPLGSAAPQLVDRTTDFGVHDVYDEASEECVPVDPDAAGYGGKLADRRRRGRGHLLRPRRAGIRHRVEPGRRHVRRLRPEREEQGDRLVPDRGRRCRRRQRIRRARGDQPAGRPLRHRTARQPRRARDRTRCRPGARRHELLVRVVGWHRRRPRARRRHPHRQRPPVRALTDDLQVVVLVVPVVVEVVDRPRVLVEAPVLLARTRRVGVELVAEGGVSWCGHDTRLARDREARVNTG